MMFRSRFVQCLSWWCVPTSHHSYHPTIIITWVFHTCGYFLSSSICTGTPIQYPLLHTYTISLTTIQYNTTHAFQTYVVYTIMCLMMHMVNKMVDHTMCMSMLCGEDGHAHLALGTILCFLSWLLSPFLLVTIKPPLHTHSSYLFICCCLSSCVFCIMCTAFLLPCISGHHVTHRFWPLCFLFRVDHCLYTACTHSGLHEIAVTPFFYTHTRVFL